MSALFKYDDIWWHTLTKLFTAFRKREPDQVQNAAVTIFAVKEEEGTLSLNPLDVLFVFGDDDCQVLRQCTGAFLGGN